MKAVPIVGFISIVILIGGCGSKATTSTDTSSGGSAPAVKPSPLVDQHAKSKDKTPRITKRAQTKHEASSEIAETSQPRLHDLTEGSNEYKLACIDQGGPVAVNGPESQHVAQLLDKMERKFNNSREQMCDIIVASHNLMVERGVTDEGVVTIMENVYESVPDVTAKDEKFNLEGVAATYVVLRTGAGK